MRWFWYIWGALIFFAPAVPAIPPPVAVAEDSGRVQLRLPPPEHLARYVNDRQFWYHRQPTVQTLPGRFKAWLWDHVLKFLLLREYAPIRRIFLFFFITATLFYALWKLRHAIWRSAFYENPATGSVNIQERPENLHTLDFERWINAAVAQQQYREAVRLLFLRALKHLADLQLIHWRPEKTNREYLAELQTDTLAGLFRELIRIFEYTWYGNFALSEEKYRRAAARFAAFEAHLRARSGAAAHRPSPAPE